MKTEDLNDNTVLNSEEPKQSLNVNNNVQDNGLNANAINDNTVLNAEQNTQGQKDAQSIKAKPAAKPKKNSNSKVKWGSFAVGGVTGVLLGSAATFLTTAALMKNSNKATEENPIAENKTKDDEKPDNTEENKTDTNTGAETLVADNQTDTETDTETENLTAQTETSNDTAENELAAANTANLATETSNGSQTVTDEMSFSEAFDTARGEVGPGGYFEWKGNFYSTFTKDEWDGMSEDEQFAYTRQAMQNYGNEINVNDTNDNHADLADATPNADTATENVEAEVAYNSTESESIVDELNDAASDLMADFIDITSPEVRPDELHNAAYTADYANENQLYTTGANSGQEQIHTADVNNGTMKCADNVNDGMSFAQAFAAAREETGAGGYFEWRGGVYLTYYKDEWDKISPEEQASLSRQAVIEHNGTAHENHNVHYNIHHDDVQHDNNDNNVHNTNDGQQNNNSSQETNYTVENQDGTLNAEEVDYIPDDEPFIADTDDNGVIEENTPIMASNYDNNNGGSEAEVEVLGVVHDDEDNSNIGGIMVDNQEVYLIDVDNDNVFDYAVSDTNKDQDVQDDEIIDIQNENINVNDLMQETSPQPEPEDNAYFASNDNGVDPDYINDANDVYEA